MKKIIALLFLINNYSYCQTTVDTLSKKEKKELQLEEVVVSGTLKAIKRLENSVPVEIITSTFLKFSSISFLNAKFKELSTLIIGNLVSISKR